MESKLSRPDSLHLNLLHLAVLAAFAFAQPLYDLLGRNPEFFLIRRIVTLDLWGFIGLVSVAASMPVLLILGGIQAGGRAAGRVCFHVLAGLLVALIALPVLKKLAWLPDPAQLAAAVLVAAGFAYGLARFRTLRSFLTLLTPAILIFPLYFIWTSPAYRIAAAEGASRVTGPRIKAQNPVVLIILDEFPVISLLDEQLRIDRARYPNFAALADRAHWFRDATTVDRLTAAAVPAILTGRYPRVSSDRLALYSETPENLFTMLADQYEIEAFEVATHLAPPERDESEGPQVRQPFATRLSDLARDTALVYANLVLPRSVLTAFPALSSGLMQIFIRADARRDQPLQDPLLQGLHRPAKVSGDEPADWRLFQHREFLAALSARPRTLYVVHSLLPHIPFRFTPSGNYYSNDMALAGWNPVKDEWLGEEAAVELAYQRHLLQLGFTDRLLGQTIRRLSELGIYDDTLFILTADHGISFRAGRARRLPDESNHAEIVHVPLLVKLPGQRDGEIHDTPVQTIDIVPTIAEVLGFPAPWQLDGQSLLAAERRPAQRQISGQPFHTDFAQVAGPALQRKLRLFGQGRAPLYPPGPRAELVGRSVGAVATLPPTDCALRFTYAKAYENVRPGQAPNYVKALLDCAPGKEAAVAVNGTIVATTRTFAGIGQGSELGVMVPEQSFRPGRNEVKSYLIENDSRGIIRLREFASR